MHISKKFLSILALALTMALLLTGCVQPTPVKVEEKVEPVVEIVETDAKDAADAVVEDAKDAAEAVTDQAEDAVANAADAAKDVESDAAALAELTELDTKAATDAVANETEIAAENVADAAKDVAGDVAAAGELVDLDAKSAAEAVTNAAQDAATQVADAAKDAVENLGEAAKDLAADLATSVEGAVSAIEGLFGEKPDIKELRVGTNPEFPPFEYINDAGVPDGFDMAIAQEIGKDIGVPVVIESMEFSALLPSLASGKIDIAIAGMTITEERKKTTQFSNPYYDASQVVIVRKAGEQITDAEGLKGKLIGVQEGTTGDLEVSDEKYEAKEVQRFVKGLDAIMELKNGKVDCVVIDSAPAAVFVALNDDLTISLLGLTVEQYGIAVKQDDAKLLNSINATLARMMLDGTYAKLVDQYINGVASPVVEAANEIVEEAAAEAAAEVPAA